MRFLVLGPLEVSQQGGDPLAIAGAKERTILAHLIARAGQIVSVDDLIDALWGAEPPRAPEKTLASYVSRLRRDLRVRSSADANGDVIVFRSDGYTLVSDGNEIDAATFERLASDGHRLLESGLLEEADPVLDRALAMWRGDAYQGFRYTRFGASEGDRLDELRRTAVEDLIDARLGGADPAALVPGLEAMVRDEPLRERRWGQLMVALYRAGRQAEALQAFRRARDVLVGDLGIEPGPELQRLQTAILSQDLPLDGGSPTRTAPDRLVDICPYKGLARFEPADADFYFGREQMVAEAVGHLVDGKFLALVGTSGSGKSSLLRAGVVHALRSGALPGSARWSCTVIRPGGRSLDTITQAIDEPSGSERRVVAIDQFEEIFTGGADAAARSSFLDAVVRATSEPDGDTTVVVAMRADFYGRCAEHRGFASLLAAGQILVGPMEADELRRAIELPAERAGLHLDEGLTDALVSDTVGQPGALPLLSTALLELWVHRRDGLLSFGDYRRGGVDGAVARLGEEAYAQLDAEGQAAAKRILLRLAEPKEGADVVRRRAPLGEFDLDRDPVTAYAMDVLTDARLVTVSEGSVEVAHEALLREWPRLRAWLDDDAEGRRLHRHATEASQAWDEGGRDAADLYRGARLTAAWDWAEPHLEDLNDLERSFLDASRDASEGEAARTRRTNRRLRGLLAGVAALLVVSLVVGDIALTQRDRATQALTVADAQRLAARSRLEADPQLALLMAKESVNIDDSAEARSALFAALERAPAITARITSPTGPSTAGDETQWIAMAPESQTIAIGDASATVELFDAIQREPIGTVEVGSGTERGTFSPDGTTLAVVTSHGDLVSIDVATGTVVARVAAEGSVDALAYAPDGARLLTAESEPRSELLIPRDPRTLEPSGTAVPTNGGEPQVAPLSSFAMAFSPDGTLLTTRLSGRGKLTTEWNADLKPIRSFAFGGNAVAMSPNGRTAAIVGNTGEGSADTRTQVAFLNIDTGVSRIASIHHGAMASTQFEILGAAFSPDGRTLVTAGNDQQLSTWNVATASITRSLGGADIPLRGPVLSADGNTAFTTDRNREVVAWNLSGSGGLVQPFTAGSGFGRWPYFAESPNGRLLAVAGLGPRSPPSIALIDTSSLEIVRRVTNPGSLPLGLAFSPDSSTLAVGSADHQQYFVRLWDVATGKPASPHLPGIEGTQVWSFAFSPTGDMLAGGGPVRSGGVGGRIYVWDLSNGVRLEGHVDTNQPVDQVAFTPDGSVLTAGTGQSAGGDLVTWNAHSLAPLLNVRVDNVGVYSTVVSNDGRAIVTGGQAGPRLWDIATGTPLGPPMTGLNGLPGTVDISPGGSTVVGADESGNVLLWDVSTGTPLGDPLPGPTPSRWMAALFSPDGTRLFAVSDAGDGWEWNVDQSDWLTRACTVAGRNLTQQEWQQLLPDQPYEAACGS